MKKKKNKCKISLKKKRKQAKSTWLRCQPEEMDIGEHNSSGENESPNQLQGGIGSAFTMKALCEGSRKRLDL